MRTWNVYIAIAAMVCSMAMKAGASERADQSGAIKTIQEYLATKDYGPHAEIEFSAPTDRYAASDRILHFAVSWRILNALDQLSLTRLALARNEIFARHGFIFKTSPWKEIFAGVPWYRQNPAFVESKVSISEEDNLDFIRSIENGDNALERGLSRAQSSDLDVQRAQAALAKSNDVGETKEIISQIKQYAEEGNIDAQCLIGDIYTDADLLVNAIPWLQRAAERGHPGAQFLLGSLYLIGGAEVHKNTSKAAQWLRKAAMQSKAGAEFSYAETLKDQKDTWLWMKKAAAQGDYAAIDWLAEHYENGDAVVQKDLVQAAAWREVQSPLHDENIEVDRKRHKLALQMTPKQKDSAHERAAAISKQYPFRNWAMAAWGCTDAYPSLQDYGLIKAAINGNPTAMAPPVTVVQRHAAVSARQVRAPVAKPDIQWVNIAGGSFTMGASDWLRSNPMHKVEVKSFQMAKTLVTNKQYKACVEAGACVPQADTCMSAGFEDDDLPALCAGWDGAMTFSKWVGGRLPSEAEWEYAARSSGKDYKYPWGNEAATCERAVIDDSAVGGLGCGRNAPWPVCSKPKGNSEQGLCDMAGNAWEWTQDWYHDSYNGAPTDGSAWEIPAGSFRVLRGGSWHNDAEYARSAYRCNDPGLRYCVGAFRPVR